MATTMFLAWLIYMFATAPTFGPESGCNDRAVYVIFRINLSATEPALRWALVGCASSILAANTVSLITMLVISGGYILVPRSDSGLTGGASDRVEEYAVWAKRMPYLLIDHFCGCIYIICMLELMLKKNNLSGSEPGWLFGQMLAMLMLTRPLIELILSVKDDPRRVAITGPLPGPFHSDMRSGDESAVCEMPTD